MFYSVSVGKINLSERVVGNKGTRISAEKSSPRLVGNERYSYDWGNFGSVGNEEDGRVGKINLSECISYKSSASWPKNSFSQTASIREDE